MSEMLQTAIERLEGEMGDWGSISMRLGDEYLSDIRTVIDAARQTGRVTWEAETYKRLLMNIGGQERVDEELDRAKALLREFNHGFPDAKRQWDDYCRSMGIDI